MRLGGVAAAWFLHLWFLLMVGIIGGLLAVSMCPLYPPEVRTTGMNFAHQVRAVLDYGAVGNLPSSHVSAKLVGVAPESAHHRHELFTSGGPH
jgi:hypothetical protein